MNTSYVILSVKHLLTVTQNQVPPHKLINLNSTVGGILFIEKQLNRFILEDMFQGCSIIILYCNENHANSEKHLMLNYCSKHGKITYHSELHCNRVTPADF